MAGGNRDVSWGCGHLAASRVGGVGIIDHDEIGGLGTIQDLNAYCRGIGIIGEADLQLSLPRRRGDLDGCFADRNAGACAGDQSIAGENAGNNKGDCRSKYPETQHDMPPA